MKKSIRLGTLLMSLMVSGYALADHGYGYGPQPGGYQPGPSLSDDSASCRQTDSNTFAITFDRTPQIQDALRLKQLLRRECRLNNVENIRLEAVRLLAISRQGQGSLTLNVGGISGQSQRVPGNPKQYAVADRLRPRDFPRIELYNNPKFSQGAWQVEVRGNVRVRRVVISLRGHGPGPGPGPIGGMDIIECYPGAGSQGFPFGNPLKSNCFAQSRIDQSYVFPNGDRGVQALQVVGVCIRGKTFGVEDRSIWVAGNCQGRFRVKLLGHNGHPGHGGGWDDDYQYY